MATFTTDSENKIAADDALPANRSVLLGCVPPIVGHKLACVVMAQDIIYVSEYKGDSHGKVQFIVREVL